LGPTAWRTNGTFCSASSIQALTDTSLVGRVFVIFGAWAFDYQDNESSDSAIISAPNPRSFSLCVIPQVVFVSVLPLLLFIARRDLLSRASG
jgi:carbon starvation protein CstA